MIIDTYAGPESEFKNIRAGTEELNFYSETGTYNRDNITCISFSISDEFISFIDRIINILSGN